MNQDPIQVQKIRAIALTVTDADRSQDFYTKALSFEFVSDITVEGQNYSDLEGVDKAKIRLVTLQLGDELIELMQYLNVEGKPIPKDSQSNDLWFQHLAIAVSDIDRAWEHLRRFPIQPISTAPQTIPPENQQAAGVRAFKFKDIDGHNLELIWFPEDKGQEKWHQKGDRLFLGIDHSAIAISTTEQSLNFYRDLLGMQVAGGSLNQGETQVRLDNLPEAKVKITALRPVSGGLGIELLDYQVTPKGRPVPRDRQSSDLVHLQVELIVNDIEQLWEKLRQNGVEFVSPGLVQFADNSSFSRQSCLVKDPDGHAMLLTSP